ncbi:MAG: hypothetical protein L6262_09095 [Weeksellaceae bacterium]|nr:hypothetical protein [Weeksellaceae bacterium]
MEYPGRIRFSSIISDPIVYSAEMFQLHPDAENDNDSGAIEIRNQIINSTFKYQLLEEGLFLFSSSNQNNKQPEYAWTSAKNGFLKIWICLL